MFINTQIYAAKSDNLICGVSVKFMSCQMLESLCSNIMRDMCSCKDRQKDTLKHTHKGNIQSMHTVFHCLFHIVPFYFGVQYPTGEITCLRTNQQHVLRIWRVL